MADVNLQSITFPGLDDRYVIPSGGTTEIFWATYGTTTNAEVEAAYQAGKAIFLIRGDYVYPFSRRVSATHHQFELVVGTELIVASVMSTSSASNAWTEMVYTLTHSPYTSTPAALGTASAGSSANYSRGDHVHPMPSASDVGAIAAPSSPTSGQFLVYNGSAWVAQTLATWQGGSY